MFLIPAFLYEIVFRQWNDTVLILIMPLWKQALVQFIFLDSRDSLHFLRLILLTILVPLRCISFKVLGRLYENHNTKEWISSNHKVVIGSVGMFRVAVGNECEPSLF